MLLSRPFPPGFSTGRLNRDQVRNDRVLTFRHCLNSDSEGILLILGVNAFHWDSSACLLRDGQLIAAAEEERFRRIKHWAGFPSQAISYCLREASVGLRDIDHVAVNQDNRANLWRKLVHLARYHPNLSLVLGRIRNRSRRGDTATLLSQISEGGQFRGSIENIEHHLCHLFSAHYVSPFSESRSNVG